MNVGSDRMPRLRNELKGDTENAKKEYLESIGDEITEFQRTRYCYLTYMKKKRK
jgi:dsRNA-specific ribonuclease